MPCSRDGVRSSCRGEASPLSVYGVVVVLADEEFATQKQAILAGG